MELCCSVDSFSGLQAAVNAGADGVRVGLSGFCASGLSMEELCQAAAWCRARDVRLAVRLDAPVSSARFPAFREAALALGRCGVSALTAADPGLIRALGLLLPDAALEAAESLCITDAAGAGLADALGVRRLLLPVQMSGSEIRALVRRCKAETEVVICGSVCAALGSCRMAAFSGGGICSQQCRERFSSETGELKPALQDILLDAHLTELAEMGVTAVCIRGENRKPSETALAVECFRRTLQDGRPLPQSDRQALCRTLLPEGGSDALYVGNADGALAELRHSRFRGLSAGFHNDAGSTEYQRVPVVMAAQVKSGSYARVMATDALGRSAEALGPVPGTAGESKPPLNAARLQAKLLNTLGTPFLCSKAVVQVDPGLTLASADLGHMCRDALDRLLEKRSAVPQVRTGTLPPLLKTENRRTSPDISISVSQAAQLSEDLAAMKPRILYVPLDTLLREPQAVTPFWENDTTCICAVLPPRYTGAQATELFTSLKKLQSLQIRDVLLNSLNPVLPARMLGFRLHGGPALQVWNDWGLRVMEDLEFASVMASPELRLSQIGELSKCIDTELFAYGRLPLFTGESRLPAALRDRRGRQYPTRELMGHSTVYSPDKLFLGDRLRDLQNLGLWCMHLSFTTENPGECVSVAERYLGMGSYLPNFRTKGLYYENETNAGFRFSQKA